MEIILWGILGLIIVFVLLFQCQMLDRVNYEAKKEHKKIIEIPPIQKPKQFTRQDSDSMGSE
jgi:hypothetical protein